MENSGKTDIRKKIRQERKEKENKLHLYVATEATGQGHKLEELVQWSQYDNVGK